MPFNLLHSSTYQCLLLWSPGPSHFQALVLNCTLGTAMRIVPSSWLCAGHPQSQGNRCREAEGWVPAACAGGNPAVAQSLLVHGPCWCMGPASGKDLEL